MPFVTLPIVLPNGKDSLAKDDAACAAGDISGRTSMSAGARRIKDSDIEAVRD